MAALYGCTGSSSRYINKNDVLAVGAPCFGISVFLTWCHVYKCVTALQQHIAMHTERSCNSWKIWDMLEKTSVTASFPVLTSSAPALVKRLQHLLFWRKLASPECHKHQCKYSQGCDDVMHTIAVTIKEAYRGRWAPNWTRLHLKIHLMTPKTKWLLSLLHYSSYQLRYRNDFKLLNVKHFMGSPTILHINSPSKTESLSKFLGSD